MNNIVLLIRTPEVVALKTIHNIVLLIRTPEIIAL